MARAPTTLDSFNAVAEPRRRRVLETLTESERSVNEIVGLLGLPQPVVSKHLSVLKEVGLVSARQEGRQRVYRLHAEMIKPIHDWARTFERFWDHQLQQIKERAEQKAKEQPFFKENQP
jgi:DNA-binding transcriptional ArsR family regulator